ncbi:4Fe-4S binding protein [Oleidesulfovibrio sp.]|uniref:4Fe-4S binding protein n=1 Tax=Oleidesulfovibrio sp. TaxID=2909707 RepID=UPI003A83ABAB
MTTTSRSLSDADSRITSARLRRTIQLCFALFSIFCGWRFYLYFHWATEQTGIFTPKPPMVEGFLPISALLGAKHFFTTGQWDPVHPAGLTIFFAAIGISLFFRKGFCGYICPIGYFSGLLERTGKRLGLNRRRPARPDTTLKKITYALLRLPKYVIMAGFFWTIGFSMNAQATASFLTSPYNQVADSKMLLFFLNPSAIALTVLAVLGIASLFITNPWCRFLCPYGALLGIFSKLSPFAIQRDQSACIKCAQCSKACPAGIAVDTKIRISNADCIGCTECITACPKQDCLQVTALGRKQFFWSICYGSVALLWISYLVAVWSGHWDVAVNADMVRMFHKSVL